MLNKELILDKQDVNELLPAGEDRKPFYHRTMNCVSFRSSDFPIRIIDESRHRIRHKWQKKEAMWKLNDVKKMAMKTRKRVVKRDMPVL